MHSLMSPAGSHLLGPNSEPRTEQRKTYHFYEATRILDYDMNTAFKSLQPQLAIKDHTIALAITLTLNTIREGTTEGEYRPYMDAARSLLANQQPRNKRFR